MVNCQNGFRYNHHSWFNHSGTEKMRGLESGTVEATTDKQTTDGYETLTVPSLLMDERNLVPRRDKRPSIVTKSKYDQYHIYLMSFHLALGFQGA